MEPYDVIVNQPVVIDNVSKTNGIIEIFVKIKPHESSAAQENIKKSKIFNKQAICCFCRDQESLKLALPGIKYQNAFFQISKSQTKMMMS